MVIFFFIVFLIVSLPRRGPLRSRESEAREGNSTAGGMGKGQTILQNFILTQGLKPLYHPSGDISPVDLQSFPLPLRERVPEGRVRGDVSTSPGLPPSLKLRRTGRPPSPRLGRGIMQDYIGEKNNVNFSNCYWAYCCLKSFEERW